MRKLFTPMALLFVAASSGGASECGEVIEDPGFDAWCGDELCNWTVEYGEVRRASTWHEKDSGVAMIGGYVMISQLSKIQSAPPNGSPTQGPCLAFDLIADVANDAEVRLMMDVNDDGFVEQDERIPTSHWRVLSYRVRLPSIYDGVRFRLEKTGGKATLANIGASFTAQEECPAGVGNLALRPGPSCETVGTPGGVCE